MYIINSSSSSSSSSSRRRRSSSVVVAGAAAGAVPAYTTYRPCARPCARLRRAGFGAGPKPVSKCSVSLWSRGGGLEQISTIFTVATEL